MRISRRSSGGRGEYEISENTPEGVTPTDLLDHRLILGFGGGTVVDTNATLRHQGGKFRIRRLSSTTIHPHRQVAALLMMPHPVREDVNWGRGYPIMRAEQYAIQHVRLEHAHMSATDARCDVGDLVLRNASYDAEELKLAERLTQVRALWANAGKFPDNVQVLIERHQALISSGSAIPQEAEKIVADLQEIVTEAREEFGIEYRSRAEDVVPDLLKSLEWSEEPPEQPRSIDEVPPEEVVIRERVIKDWKRWASYRGAKSARFRQDVRRAYNSACVVCGLHLPPTTFNSVAGVDAAHILPWASYDLDEVSNGVCLCKNHHWAFDEGLIVIGWDGQHYFIQVPDEVVITIKEQTPAFSIDELLEHAGVIPGERLPTRVADRPRPQFLRLFAEKLRGG